jgi:hypothetical protein
MFNSQQRFCPRGGAAKYRLADSIRIEVVEIEMQLRDNADIAAAFPVDRDQRLDAELKHITDPDHTGIDGAGGVGAGCKRVRHWRLQVRFHQRNEMVDEIRQAEIDYGRLQIGHAVLVRTAPVEHPRIEVGIYHLIAGVRIDTERRDRALAGGRITDLAGDCDGPDPGQRIGEIAKSFAEIERRRVDVEGFRRDIGSAGATAFDAEPDRHHEFMRGVLENAIFERGLKILKAVGSGCRRIDRGEEGIGRAERDREILGDSLGKLTGKDRAAVPAGRRQS